MSLRPQPDLLEILVWASLRDTSFGNARSQFVCRINLCVRVGGRGSMSHLLPRRAQVHAAQQQAAELALLLWHTVAHARMPASVRSKTIYMFTRGGIASITRVYAAGYRRV